jgi:signal transduction histidine kinase
LSAVGGSADAGPGAPPYGWPMRLRRHAFDALVLAVAAASQVEILVAPRVGPIVAVEAAALLATVPLLFRRRFPFAAPAVVFAGLAGVSLVSLAGVTEGATFAMLGLVLACWAAGAQREGQQALAAAALGLAAFAVIVQAHPGSGTALDFGDAEVDLASWLVIGIGLPLAAFALRRREERAVALEAEAERLAREREERARAAVAAERARIARDLHDVIAHSVSVMTVQGGAARLLLEQDAQRAREPLLAVEETGHQAMAEMRRLLGIVHAEEAAPALAPQPGLADLEALTEQVRQAGLPVALEVQGAPKALAPGLGLAGYRIVQEALTNALKHAGPARAWVTVRYDSDALVLEIADDGSGGGSDGGGSGHGLVGMRERVALYGGELAAGTRPGGGFAVRARLPLGPRGGRDLQAPLLEGDDGREGLRPGSGR